MRKLIISTRPAIISPRKAGEKVARPALRTHRTAIFLSSCSLVRDDYNPGNPHLCGARDGNDHNNHYRNGHYDNGHYDNGHYDRGRFAARSGHGSRGA